MPTSTTTTAATTTATPSPPTTTQKEGTAYTEVKVDDLAGRTGAGAAVMSKGGSASSGADGDAGILAGSGVGKKANEVQVGFLFVTTPPPFPKQAQRKAICD